MGSVAHAMFSCPLLMLGSWAAPQRTRKYLPMSRTRNLRLSPAVVSAVAPMTLRSRNPCQASIGARTTTNAPKTKKRLNTKRPQSNVERRTPNVERRASNFERRTSNVERRPSNVTRRTSNVAAGGRRSADQVRSPPSAWRRVGEGVPI